MVVGITILFTIINLTVIFIEWYVFSPLLEFVALFYGVFIGWHAVSLWLILQLKCCFLEFCLV